MPSAFIGHGTPMNALERNAYTTMWGDLGRSVPRPRAILVASAHWYTDATAVTAMPQPRTIHDFYGFPQPLYQVQYPAPGLPELADEIADLVRPTALLADTESWGLDHGAWIILVHAFPGAAVPVVELSVNGMKDLDYHFALGRSLAPLREHGVLVLFSGNIVHNLRGADLQHPERVYDWNRNFDEAAKRLLLTDPAAIPSLRGHRHFADAVPTPDHFLPFVQFAGLASAAPEEPQVLLESQIAGSISMTSYAVGIPA